MHTNMHTCIHRTFGCFTVVVIFESCVSLNSTVYVRGINSFAVTGSTSFNEVLDNLSAAAESTYFDTQFKQNLSMPETIYFIIHSETYLCLR